jgi:hypothetical protein
MSSKVMKASQAIYACGCLDKLNEQLAAHNTVVETGFWMNFTTGRQGEGLMIATCKKDPKKRGRALKVDAKFCPWCGIKYDFTSPARAPDLRPSPAGKAVD